MAEMLKVLIIYLPPAALMTYNTQSTDLGQRKTVYIAEQSHHFLQRGVWFAKKCPIFREMFTFFAEKISSN